MKYFDKLTERKTCYEIDGFKPIEVDAALLIKLGLDYPINESVDHELIAGTERYKTLFESKSLNPENSYFETLTDPEKELEVHNYTGICPTNVLEVSPSEGSCSVGCQYCLVTDGKHVKKINIFTNYTEKLANSLERNKDRKLYYYFSPKTEALSEAFLFNGMAHDIFRTFIKHYELHPDSNVRIFVATKAGPQHLEIKHKGDSVLDLISVIPSKIQVNGSIGIMPEYLRDILEPNAASISERLEALKMLRRVGVWSESVLCQPLFLPYLTETSVKEYITLLAMTGVKNIKPEFFTAEISNLVLVSQYINHYDPEKLMEFFYPYLMADNLNHIKQRARLAPDRETCTTKLQMIRDIAKDCGVSISLCNWVKKELGGVAEWVKQIDTASTARGYSCLGYQKSLFA